MQNVFFFSWSSRALAKVIYHLPSAKCWHLSCLKFSLKAVLRDNFLTELNEEGNGYLQIILRSNSRRKLLCNTCKEPRKTCISFYFDFFSWRVPHLPTAPGCIPGWHRAAKCVGWVLSMWAATFPHGRALSILHTATASRPCATLRTSTLIVMCKGVWEREGKGKLSFHILPGADILGLKLLAAISLHSWKDLF